ncbi:MAG: multiheme c-type cytochrome [Maribacter sp.]|uniref:multiheme c-type cytochrome n=1 Tax=Maribacter sp. TaxID=1897614 RepID=UPI00329860B3
MATHSNGDQFVGSETCLECHADIYAAHIKTAHFNTSAPGNAESIKGNFEAGSNILDLESVTFKLRSKGDSFYQHTEIKNRLVKKPAARFDIVIGSGIRGQSYLTWDENQLFQLQTSYYTPTNSWVNSPGFPSYSIERPVREACIKCHVTFAKTKDYTGQGNTYDKSQMIFGIDCERCHRPAAKHVAYHKNNPYAEKAKFMMKYDTLSRQQSLDACAQCHSGLRGLTLKGNSFSFLAGYNLNEYARNFDTGNQNTKLDVHGNQYGLLIESQCFKQAKSMDCATCHNPHIKQRGNTAYFNQKCIGCHSESVVCTAASSSVQLVGNNCVACHMPTTPSTSMTVQLGNDSLETAFNIRTHLIGIYSDAN